MRLEGRAVLYKSSAGFHPSSPSSWSSDHFRKALSNRANYPTARYGVVNPGMPSEDDHDRQKYRATLLREFVKETPHDSCHELVVSTSLHD